MMSDLRSFSKSFVIDFIDTYESMPCLWKIKSCDYTNKELKNVAYERLAAKLREVIPDATKDIVIKKIDSMRGSFRREFKKLQKSLKTCSGPNEAYKPKLWYFEKLLFLKDQKIPKRAARKYLNILGSDKEKVTAEPTSSKQQDETISLDDSISQPPAEAEPEPQQSSSSQISHAFPIERRRKKYHKNHQKIICEDVLRKISDKLDAPNIEDEYDVVAKNIAFKLRRLSNEVRMVSEKFILDVLFNAEMGCINKYTTLSLNNPVVTEGFINNITSRASNSSNSACSNSGNFHNGG